MAHFSLVETCSQNLQKTLFSFRLFAHTVLSIHSRAPFFVTFRRGMRRTRVGCEQCERSRRQNPTIPRVGHHTTHCFSSTWRRRRQNPTISRGGHHTIHCFSSRWRSRRQNPTIPCWGYHTIPCIVWVVNGGTGVKRLQFHVGNTIPWFFAQYWKCGTRTWRRRCQKTTFLRKVHSYTHCSTIEKCSRMEDLKKQVSKGYNSTSHMAGLQSEVELQCNLYKKRSNSSNSTFPTPSFLMFCRPEKTSQATRRHPRLFTHSCHFLLHD